MSLRLFRLFGARRRTIPTTRPQSFFRPSLEGLEVREVLSSPARFAPPELAAALVRQAQQEAFTIVPVQVTGVSFQGGQLLVEGLVGNNPFSTTATLTAQDNPSDPDCPILNLHLAPIHLDLLGLTVDTSDICLNVTAHSGGGLLGNLLCDVANLLNGGPSLGGILGSLTADEQALLQGGLTDLLNGALGRLTSSSSVSGAECNILHLSLGPVNLNLLGLEVNLDNCAAGPVTLDITAQPGPGQLLGNLLCDVSHLLDNGASIRAVDRLLGRVATTIGGLI